MSVAHKHTLETLRGLLSVLEVQFERFPHLAIDWITSEALEAHFGFAVSAACYCLGNTKAIVILDDYQRAPLYVLRYLVLHEALHVIHPPRGSNMHHYAFRCAEQASSDYVPACRWLHRHHNQKHIIRRPEIRKCAYWRKILAPIYGGDSKAAYTQYRLNCAGG